MLCVCHGICSWSSSSSSSMSLFVLSGFSGLYLAVRIFPNKPGLCCCRRSLRELETIRETKKRPGQFSNPDRKRNRGKPFVSPAAPVQIWLQPVQYSCYDRYCSQTCGGLLLLSQPIPCSFFLLRRCWLILPYYNHIIILNNKINTTSFGVVTPYNHQVIFFNQNFVCYVSCY